jgi:Lhr-like helicase
VQREFNVKVNEVQNGSDKQMGEICMMIEELAKVVRSFESQISNVKALNENILSTKLDTSYVHDFEKLVQAQITLAVQKHEEKTQQVIAELS